MNIEYIIILVIFTILILIGIIIIGIYNQLLFRKNKVLDKLNTLSDSLKERQNIINNIKTVLKSHNYHEDDLLLELDLISKEIESNTSPDEILNLINKSDLSLKKALSLDQNYKDLAKNKDYITQKDTFKNNQYKIMYAVEIYNQEVEEYSNYQAKKIITIISKVFQFPNYSYYKKDHDL